MHWQSAVYAIVFTVWREGRRTETQEAPADRNLRLHIEQRLRMITLISDLNLEIESQCEMQLMRPS
jgi:hypothetical protein